MYKFAIYLILVLIITVSASFSQVFQCNIEMEKTEYLLGETAWVAITFTNNSSEVIYLHKDQLRHELTIKDQSGKQFHSIMAYDLSGAPALMPNKTLLAIVNLLGSYGIYDHNDVHFSVLPVGFYRVSLDKHFNNDPDRIDITIRMKAFTLKSNEIQFRVQEPQDQEAEAFQLLNTANLILRNGIGRSGIPNQSNSMLVDLINKFPGSVYVEHAYLQIFGNCYRKGCEDCGDLWLEYNRQFLDRFPNSGFYKWAINSREWYYRGRHDSEGARTFYHELICDHPGTRVAKEAQWRLDRMDKLTVDQWSELHKLTKNERKELGLD